MAEALRACSKQGRECPGDFIDRNPRWGGSTFGGLDPESLTNHDGSFVVHLVQDGQFTPASGSQEPSP